MEKILRSQKLAEIILLPVRHHSPACAYHIQRMIRKLHPSVILIEGPENANAMIRDIVHADTQAPFAIYYSCTDRKKQISEEREHYRCYYPFLDYSPELVALRTGDAEGIPVHFIDLSYGEILLASKEGKGLRKEAEKHNYNDDYYLSQNEYLHSLCERTGMRSFDEFWEKYFELPVDLEDEKWFENLLLYCQLARENTGEQELAEEGCLSREAHMAENIRHYAAEVYPEGSVLVITGGFHTPGLTELLKKEEPPQKKTAFSGEQGVYLMPYSMEAADALNGYASGMPYPGFYQKIWEQDQDYEKAVLDLLIRTAREVRRKEGSPSTYDEICAYQMAQDLAVLRDKKMPGVYELLDAVLGAYVKGEYTMATDMPMRTLSKLLTGDQIGTLWAGCDVPPIVQDFRSKCKTYGLHVGTSLPQKSVLNIFTSDKHRQMSQFFHRMVYLNTGFAKREKGPNLQTRTNRYLVREIWEYRWMISVDSALIESSVYGGTVEEAVNALVKKRLQEEVKAEEAALILIAVFEMGMADHMLPVYDRVCQLVQNDTDFFSLANALRSMLMLKELVTLYESELSFDELIHTTIQKLLLLLPAMTRIKDEDAEKYRNILKLLFQICEQEELQLQTEKHTFLEVLWKMVKDPEIHPELNGCIHGILYGCAEETEAQIQLIGKGYLSGTKEKLMQTAQFFHGLFFTARDLVFTGDAFLQMLDQFMGEVDSEQYMELLPDLRMAFSFFIPGEINKIAKNVARFHQMEEIDLMKLEEVLPTWYEYGKSLDEYVGEKQKEEA